MTMPRILFVPDRFTDYRLWTDIPDRIQGRAEVIHLDQHEQIPWAGAGGGFLAAVRRLAGAGVFDIVVAAGQAARFAFAIAEAGLARGLIFVYPWPDCLLDELPDADLAEVLKPYLPVAAAVREGDIDRLRDVLVQVACDTAGPDAEPRELQRLIDMLTDHAGELLTSLRATQAAAAADPSPPDPLWLERPWIDRLATLTVPVIAIVAPGSTALGDMITRRARDAEIVVADQLVPVALPSGSAEVIVRMLDRLT
jgi:hypothetical protein